MKKSAKENEGFDGKLKNQVKDDNFRTRTSAETKKHVQRPKKQMDATNNAQDISAKSDGEMTGPSREAEDDSARPPSGMISSHGQNYKRRNNKGKPAALPGAIAVTQNGEEKPRSALNEGPKMTGDTHLPGSAALHSYQRRNQRENAKMAANTVEDTENHEQKQEEEKVEIEQLPGSAALHSYQRRNQRENAKMAANTVEATENNEEEGGLTAGNTKHASIESSPNQTTPGAIRVRPTHLGDSIKSTLTNNDTLHSYDTNKEFNLIDGDGEKTTGSSRYLAEAFLVEESSRKENKQQSAPQQPIIVPPLVEASPLVEEEKPWYTKKWALGLILITLVIAIVVAVVVPLTVGGGPSPPSEFSNTPSMSPFPSAHPSVFPSFAPTMTTTITAVLQLDNNPPDISWRIDCDSSGNLVNIPSPTYNAAHRNRTITVPKDVGVGETCVIEIRDASKNGLEGGFFLVVLGTDYDSEDKVVLAEGDGDFGEKAIMSFDINLPPSSSPSEVPSLQPTVSIEPTLSQVPSLQPTITNEPTISPRPTPVPDLPNRVPSPVTIMVEIQLDEIPSETGWSLTCSGAAVGGVTTETYVKPFGFIQESFEVYFNSDCEFVIEDKYGDGICCALGEGYYQIVLDGDFLLANQTGDASFKTMETVVFRANPNSPQVGIFGA